jgi:ATP-dependent Lhr-like helicase
LTERNKSQNEGIAVVVSNTAPDKLQDCLHGLLKEGLPDTFELAKTVPNKA